MSKMNLPNKLTMLRLFMVPVMVVFLLLPARLVPHLVACGVGFVLFVLTSLTDMLDGKIARANNLITNFGKFMDPVADKFMVIGTMLALLFRMIYPGLYGFAYNRVFITVYFISIVLVIFRELAITSLRLVLVNASGEVVAANLLGKIKTVTQIIAIGALFVEPILHTVITRFAPNVTFFAACPLSFFFIVLMLFFTVVSGVNYIAAGWKFISSDW